MSRGAWRGFQNDVPLFLRYFSICFGLPAIYILFLLFEDTEVMFFFWGTPKMALICRGDVHGVPKCHRFRLRGVVFAPLNTCRQGVTTKESRVIYISDFPKIKFLYFNFISQHFSQK